MVVRTSILASDLHLAQPCSVLQGVAVAAMSTRTSLERVEA